MRRLLFLAFAMLLSMNLLAQLEVKDNSFKEVSGFVNINNEKMYDDNNKPYAVLKVKTENLNDKQRHELLFQGDAATFFEVEYKTGEVWVYLSYYATYIKISHPDLSSTEFHFPFDMKPKCGYELTLVNKTTNVSNVWGSLTITTNPEVCATIALNGRVLAQKTPYNNDMIPAGIYEITLSKDKFQTITKSIEIKNEEHEYIEITMQYIYGLLHVTSEPLGATVFIDNQYYGITPLELKDKIVVGNHELRLEKETCATLTKAFVLEENKKLYLNEQLQTGKEIIITTDREGDKVFVDGKYIGTSPIKVELKFGDHEIVAVRGYDQSIANIVDVPQDVEMVKKTITVSWIDVQLVFGEGTINGVFSVSANKKVKFSQGNLQYQASTNTWRFADNQLDIMGESNNKTSSSYSGWIDLFGWGTGNNPIKKTTDNAAYTVYTDWGNNSILNGKNKNWWTLSKEEWNYVLFKRNTTTGIRYVKAIINGVNGIVLLPDNWSDGIYQFPNANTSNASFSSNRISFSDWTNKLEVNGAVFLPAAGYNATHPSRSYSSLRNIYWSSTSSCGVEFSDTHALEVNNYCGPALGCCVRLVCDAE